METPGWNKSVRDFRNEFTQAELSRLIERFYCLYTREPAEEWNHSSAEMLAVLQEAQSAAALKSSNARLLADNAELRSMIPKFSDRNAEALRQQRDAANKEVERLREALKKCGHHAISCDHWLINNDGEHLACTCGLAEALNGGGNG